MPIPVSPCVQDPKGLMASAHNGARKGQDGREVGGCPGASEVLGVTALRVSRPFPPQARRTFPSLVGREMLLRRCCWRCWRPWQLVSIWEEASTFLA